MSLCKKYKYFLFVGNTVIFKHSTSQTSLKTTGQSRILENSLTKAENLNRLILNSVLYPPNHCPPTSVSRTLELVSHLSKHLARKMEIWYTLTLTKQQHTHTNFFFSGKDKSRLLSTAEVDDSTAEMLTVTVTNAMSLLCCHSSFS